MLKNKSNILDNCYKLGLFLSFFPLLFYCYISLKYSTNAPYYDDYFWGFQFLDKYITSNSIFEKLSYIFELHAQHRIANLRIFIVTFYYIFGEVNFKIITIFGNISTLVIFLIIFLKLRKVAIGRLFLFPLSLILFQFQYYQNIACTYGFPNMGVLMWGILSFYFVGISTRWAFIFTIICSILAIFSNGAGVLCIPIILFFLIIQKRYKHLIISTIFFIIICLAYFSNYENEALTIILNAKSISYFFKFLSVAFFTGHNKIELAAVLFILVFFIIKFFIDSYNFYFKNKKNSDYQLWIISSASIGWIIATALSVTLYRASHNSPIPNWYYNYSILLIIFFTTFFLVSVKNNTLRFTLFILLIGYGFTNYLKNIRQILPTIAVFHSNLNADVVNFKNHNNWSFLLTQIGPDRFDDFQNISQKFYHSGIYRPIKANYLLNDTLGSSTVVKVNFKQEIGSAGESLLHFYLPNYSPKLSHIRDRFGFIKSGTKIYYFGVMNPVKNSVWEIIKSGHLYYDEPFFIVPNQFYKSAIETGEYNIGMVYISETNQTNWYLSDQKVIINNY